MLENSYLFFRIYPLGATATSIKKMPKLYFFDLPRIESESARFENCIALALYKEVMYQNEAMGADLQLRFVRNKDKQEIDFVILEGKKVSKSENDSSRTELRPFISPSERGQHYSCARLSYSARSRLEQLKSTESNLESKPSLPSANLEWYPPF